MYGEEHINSGLVQLHFNPEELHFSVITGDGKAVEEDETCCYVCNMEFENDDGEDDWVGCECCPRWICGHCISPDFDTKLMNYVCKMCKLAQLT